MKQKITKSLAFLTMAIMIFSNSLGNPCGNSGYIIDASPVFWDNVQVGGCDYIDSNGCLMHVVIYKKYRLWINFGEESQTTRISC